MAASMEPGESVRRPMVAWPLLVLALVALRTLWLASAAWPFTTDDAYIALRYAQNLAAGHGVTFNPGVTPPVEGYSSPLFVWLGAASLALGDDPVRWLKGVGVAALLAQHGVLYALARRLLPPALALVPVLWLTAMREQLHWTASGLETAVYQLWCTAAALALFRAHGYPLVHTLEGGAALAPRPVPAAGWLCAAMGLSLLAAVTRPEGPLLALCVAVACLSSAHRAGRAREALRPLAIACACFALPYLVYFAWRLDHFGRLLPNSVLCKSGYPADPLWLVRDFGVRALPYLVCLLGLSRRRLDGRHVMLLLPTLLYVAILCDVDPIIGHLLRHFLAPLALLLPLCALGLGGVLSRLARGHRGVAVVVLVLVGGWTSLRAFVERPVLAAYAERYAGRMQARAKLGRWLAHEVGPDGSYVIGDTGLVPYLAGGRVFDALCLNSGAMTRPPIDRDPARFADHVYAAAPDALVMTSRRPDRLESDNQRVFTALARHPDFALYHHTLTAGLDGDDLFYRVYRRQRGDEGF